MRFRRPEYKSPKMIKRFGGGRGGGDNLVAEVKFQF